ncbi:ADI_G0040110.mRNA.1.CDS.1 [Saccharomyces cerevisiae]|nr:BLD_1a_G0034480.mRNA.1.CDS.1 [Saccharomyces cerevisiae]CAI4593911.1 AHG_G0034450.mRNA.1.CDS.1 [Saccharomyces cerevisiae]CAI4596045.1 CFS_G0034700.mRNA.1.CDS.1 [Saccharomyces cerevisiae]CAI4598821.1 AMP_1a_G0034700.mRNA.1.CDS.1 [Saccharomyces cerevisiae]CAI4599794.1 CNB_1a_G0034630.mRNA.1.CDS.1 [Saccharomyces cerevisiae]
MSNESNDLEKNISHLDPTGVDNAYIPPEQPETKHSRFNIDRDTLRNHFIAAVGEFCGTFMFLWCAYVICNVANHDVALTTEPEGSHPGQLIMIALGFGFSVIAISPARCVVMWFPQIIAGMAAGGAASAMTPGKVLFTNALGLGCSRSRGLFLEMFGTAVLCLTVLMTAVEKRETNFMAALPIGISLFMAHMALTGYTGTGVNPARSLGAAVAARYFPHYHWIYWISPLLGAFLAWSVWQLLQILDYTTYVNAEKAAGQKKED